MSLSCIKTRHLKCSLPECNKFAQFGIHTPTHCRTHVPPDDMHYHEFDISKNKANSNLLMKKKIPKMSARRKLNFEVEYNTSLSDEDTEEYAS